MDLYLETFEVGQLVQDVAAIVQPLVEKNGNTLVVDCPDDIGDDARRPDQGPPDAVQPALERRQVHRSRRDRVASVPEYEWSEDADGIALSTAG